MNLSTLLGKKLKDDEVLEVINDYDIGDVTYYFDRDHENMEDIYWAPSFTAGFQMRFDEHQTLDTIFCYIVENEGFSPISPEIIGASVYKTFDEAELACKRSAYSYSISDASKGPEFHKLWLRVQLPDIWIHYQFKEEVIFRVTLSLPSRSL